MANLRMVVEARARQPGRDRGGVTRYLVDQAKNQDGVNRTMASVFGDHRPGSTSDEVGRLAIDLLLILALKAVAIVPDTGSADLRNGMMERSVS